jgi:hypothetical protein
MIALWPFYQNDFVCGFQADASLETNIFVITLLHNERPSGLFTYQYSTKPLVIVGPTDNFLSWEPPSCAVLIVEPGP